LSAFKDGDKIWGNNMIDFAGSGVVHMVGGCSGLMGAVALGPRKGRFEEGGEAQYRPHSVLSAALGVCILWFGWYGFNAGSTLAISGYGGIAAKVTVTTTIAAALGALTCTVYARVVPKEKTWDLMLSLNGVLAGLVSITAGCCVVDPWAAAVIGIIGALIYIGASNLLKKLKIDDPLDAFPIHGCCGFWGVLAVGIFSSDANIKFGYDGAPTYSTGEQFGVQLAGATVIAVWTLGTSGALFFTLKALKILRVSEKMEEDGMDASEHGGQAYNFAAEEAMAAVPMVRVKQVSSSDAVPAVV
jgi:Amt family ammonium transporter